MTGRAIARFTRNHPYVSALLVVALGLAAFALLSDRLDSWPANIHLTFPSEGAN